MEQSLHDSRSHTEVKFSCFLQFSGVPGGGGVQNTPAPEIPKTLQNRAKLNPIVKTVKNC